MAKNLIDYWFVASPDDEKIVKVAMIGPLGMCLRQGSNWVLINPGDSGIDENTEDKIYAYDWASDTSPLPDDFTDEDLTPEAIKKFDGGSLTVADLEGVAALIYDGTDKE